jgi:DNA/RNA-binding domain of Phe-tRNA-synthetase-like protein
MSQEDFNPKQVVDELLTRSNRTLRQWRKVYSTIGVPFQYKPPSADDYVLAINIVTRAARVAKEENKNDSNNNKKSK